MAGRPPAMPGFQNRSRIRKTEMIPQEQPCFGRRIEEIDESVNLKIICRRSILTLK
jgi:hypothetical protein